MTELKTTLCDQIRGRLTFIAEQAVQGIHMSVDDDNLCDLMDSIDNDVQATIELINRARSEEVS